MTDSTQAQLDALNLACDCYHIDRSHIDSTLQTQIQNPFEQRQLQALLSSKNHLFANTSVFVSDAHMQTMTATVTAIESAVRLPSYRRIIAARDSIPQSLLDAPPTHGLFMGYDFHLAESGPKLIEINTNAGGGFLVHGLLLAVSQQRLGLAPELDAGQSMLDPHQLATSIVKMFRTEWALGLGASQQPQQRLHHIAIVDELPREQYLYPDMLLAKALLESHDIRVSIVDPAELEESHGTLTANGLDIDLLYNRLTDFSLASANVRPLLRALTNKTMATSTVISPNPWHHALHADKRNLSLLTNQQLMREWGLPESTAAALENIAPTVSVDYANASALWAQRKSLFFKPAKGFGSKAVYRGSKLTRRTWRAIVNSEYVAQQLVEPPQRQIDTLDMQSERAEPPVHLKFDVRLYSYAGSALAVAARAYRGQTTNFRTPGGGFAPVVVLPPPLIKSYLQCCTS